MILLMEAKPYDPVTAQEVTVRLSSGAKAPIYDGSLWQSRLQPEFELGVEIFRDGFETASSSPSIGEIKILLGDVLNDQLVDYSWEGRSVKLWIGHPDDAFAAMTLIYDGAADSISYTSLELTVALADWSIVFDQPLGLPTYLGTGGLEGGDDLKDKVKPCAFGPIFNAEPVLVDAAYLIYQVHYQGCQSIDNVFDQGLPLTSDGDTTDLLAWSSVPGKYKTDISKGLVRLGAQPVGLVTIDLHGDSVGGYIETAADLFLRVKSLIPDASGVTVDAAAFAALNIAQPAACSLYFKDALNASQLFDVIMRSVGGFWRVNWLGELTAGIIDMPAASGTITTRDILSYSAAAADAPIWKLTHTYRPNYRIHAAGELAAQDFKLKDALNLIDGVWDIEDEWETRDPAHTVTADPGGKYSKIITAAATATNNESTLVSDVPVKPGDLIYAGALIGVEAVTNLNAEIQLAARQKDKDGNVLSYVAVLAVIKQPPIVSSNTYYEFFGDALIGDPNVATIDLVVSNRDNHTVGKFYIARPWLSFTDRGATRNEHRGQYDAAEIYRKGDVVSYGGSSYTFVNSSPASGIAPPNATYWSVMAEKGAGTFTLVPGNENIVVSANSIERISGTGWNRGARSIEGYADGAFLSFKTATVDKNYMIGLNTDPETDESYVSLDYAWYIYFNGTVAIYESGVNQGSFGPYTDSTFFQIIYDGQRIRYLMDGVLKREVTVAITDALYLDSSFSSTGGKAVNITFGPAGPRGLTYITYRQALEPSSPNNGDIWYNTTNSLLYSRQDNTWNLIASYNTGALANKNTIATSDINLTAVTNSWSGGNTSGFGFVNNTWITIAAVTVTLSGQGKIRIEASTVFISEPLDYWVNIYIRIREGSATYIWGGLNGVRVLRTKSEARVTPFAGLWLTRSAGSYTYYLEAKSDDVGSSSGTHPYISVMETKR